MAVIIEPNDGGKMGRKNIHTKEGGRNPPFVLSHHFDQLDKPDQVWKEEMIEREKKKLERKSERGRG